MYPKRNLLSIILLCIICVIVIFFTSCSKYDWSEDKTKGEGGGNSGGLASTSVSLMTISLTRETHLEASFNFNFGVITVKIINSNNKSLVYSNTIDTSINDFLTIDISTLSSGSYKVSFVDTKDNIIANHSFVIN